MKSVKYGKKVRNHLNTLYNRDEQVNILTAYGISKLPEISLNELFGFLNDDGGELRITSDFSNGISPVNDYYFLCRIAKALNTKKYFEIGTWVGLSARNISETLGDDSSIYSLDIPFDHPEIRIFNIPTENFGYYSRGRSNVNFLKSDSKVFDFSPFEKSIDLIFIDGNHAADYVESDTENALLMLKNDNSIIAWHDYMILGDVNNEVLCGILQGIPKEEHKHLIHLKQSNMALFSRSFNFIEKKSEAWEIPEVSFELTFKNTRS